jgi:hypothetical protein
MKRNLLIAAVILLSLPCSAMAAETNLEAAYKICQDMVTTPPPPSPPPPPDELKSNRESYAIYRYLCLAVGVMHDPKIQTLVNGILNPNGTAEPHKYSEDWQKLLNNLLK